MSSGITDREHAVPNNRDRHKEELCYGNCSSRSKLVR